jgi:hypothetical protein
MLFLSLYLSSRFFTLVSLGIFLVFYKCYGLFSRKIEGFTRKNQENYWKAFDQIPLNDKERQEAEEKREVWKALSELWLDQELQITDLKDTAQTLYQSSYSLQELEKIYLYEVAPVVYKNLYSVTGIWTGFDSEWLTKSILLRKRRRFRPLEWLLRFSLGKALVSAMVQKEWNTIIYEYQALEKGISEKTA